MKSKTLFTTMLMMSTVMTMSSNNWLSMWMSLEINMMAFIPMMNSPKSMKSSEASIIYFLTQSMSSMIMIMSLMINTMHKMSMIMYLLTMSILIKLGMAPFHMWFLETMSKMTWKNSMIIMTWQKLAPMSMMNSLNFNNMMNYSIIMSIMLISITVSMNQTSLRKIMSYSSINHMSWMMINMKSSKMWMNYMLIYSLMMIPLCMTFNHYNMYFMNQFKMYNMSMMEKLSIMMSLASLGGMPPFTGFLLKWMTMQIMMHEYMYIMMWFMTMSSMIMLFIYLRMMNTMIMLSSTTTKWTIMNKHILYTTTILLTNNMLPIMMIMNMK